ncbi:polysaccharide pyruvyl transferase family protein [Collimonas sp. H4R21]|uniref:Polysaccharide pyruvyl transferase family protein n=1 Tax=Collimonas rhizosphaerae TaxID=3126357 RepID=A0ABU9Q0C1_9BURK
MKIVICAVPYSPNLGDGVIYENIKQLLLERVPGAQVSALDIAGRDDYVKTGISKKSLVNKVPKRLRPYAVCTYFSLQYFLRWRRKWVSQLADADLVVVGGGQLLLDVHLNFPVKLFLLSKAVKAAGKSGKVAVFGVGVSKSMSSAGTGLTRRTWENLAPIQASTRDIASAQNLKLILGQPLDVKVTPDPGIYSQQTFAAFLPPRATGNVLGICISSPLELNQAGMEKQDYSERIGKYFQELAIQAVTLGYRVHLFTNGSPEDEAFKDALAAGLDPEIVNLPRPGVPSQLVANIGQCDCVIAHRLHANIVAYALDIPSIGLNWDSKVQSFFELTGRGRFFMPAPVPDVTRTFKLLYQALQVDGTGEKLRLTQQLTTEIAALLERSGLAGKVHAAEADSAARAVTAAA